jgi:hypothetical protein
MPDDRPADAARAGNGAADELHAAAPILGWTALYLIVAAALLVEIAVFTALTLGYR